VADAELESAEDTCAAENHKENPHGPPMQLQPFRYHGEAYRMKLCNQGNDQRENEQE